MFSIVMFIPVHFVISLIEKNKQKFVKEDFLYNCVTNNV